MSFTVIGTPDAVFVFSPMVVLPYVWALLDHTLGIAAPWLRDGVRYGPGFAVDAVLYALLYGWLPDIRQRLRTGLPGVVIGAMMWVGAAALLSYTLRSAGKPRLRRADGDAGLPLRQRRHVDLRRRGQCGAAGRPGGARA